MKALTVKQPWAHAIMYLGKNVENRSWSTNYRGLLAIHAGRAYDYNGGTVLDSMGYNTLVDMPGGVILGTVELIDCVSDRMRDNPWAEQGQWHWILANPVPVSTPFTVRGKLGLWTPDDDTITSLTRSRRGRAPRPS